MNTLEINKKKNNSVSNLKIRKDILDFEAKLSKMPGAVLGDNNITPVKHSFSEGVYSREMFIPKGMALVGKIHKHACHNFILKGDITVWSEEEGEKRIKAPYSFVSKPGTKRVGYAHEDTIWVNVHSNPDNKTDLSHIEDRVIAKDYDDYENHKKQISKGTQNLLSNSKVKNCGLDALNKISPLKKTSVRTLIDLAEDNGLPLYAYQVPIDKLNKIPFPAIFHSENHFEYISKKEDLGKLKYTGVVLHTKKINFPEIDFYELEEIVGETWVSAGMLSVYAAVAVAGGSITAASIAKEKPLCKTKCKAKCKNETSWLFGGRGNCKKECQDKCYDELTPEEKLKEMDERSKQKEKSDNLYIIAGVCIAVAVVLGLYMLFKKK